MIEINVAPLESRKKRKKTVSAVGVFKIPREAIIGLVGGLIVLLFLAHISLLVVTSVKVAAHARLKSRWQEVKPDKDRVDVVINELRTLQTKINAVEKVTTAKRLSWARKLNALIRALPRGIWIRKLSLDGNVLIIDGSAHSKVGKEMISVGNFASNLKTEKGFMHGLDNIEVGSIQRGKIKNVDIANFLITVKLKR